MRGRPTAMAIAQKLLAAREKTRAQLEAALLRKGYQQDEVLEVIERLSRAGLLSDRRAAELHARKGLEARHSTNAISHKLRSMGVDEADVEQVVAEVSASMAHHDEDAAKALLRQRKLTGVKAARFLAGRGFDEELIRRLVTLDDEG